VILTADLRVAAGGYYTLDELSCGTRSKPVSMRAILNELFQFMRVCYLKIHRCCIRVRYMNFPTRVCTECGRTYQPSSGHHQCPSCRSHDLCACGAKSRCIRLPVPPAVPRRGNRTATGAAGGRDTRRATSCFGCLGTRGPGPGMATTSSNTFWSWSRCSKEYRASPRPHDRHSVNPKTQNAPSG